MKRRRREREREKERGREIAVVGNRQKERRMQNVCEEQAQISGQKIVKSREVWCDRSLSLLK